MHCIAACCQLSHSRLCSCVSGQKEVIASGRVLEWSHDGRQIDAHALDDHDVRRAGENYVDESFCM